MVHSPNVAGFVVATLTFVAAALAATQIAPTAAGPVPAGGLAFVLESGGYVALVPVSPDRVEVTFDGCCSFGSQVARISRVDGTIELRNPIRVCSVRITRIQVLPGGMVVAGELNKLRSYAYEAPYDRAEMMVKSGGWVPKTNDGVY